MLPLRASREHLLRRANNARTITRPSATGSTFAVTYVRTGPFEGATPLVVIPGGPGLASVQPYLALRTWARANRIDLIMIEHRGVGLSRRTVAGADLTPDDMWVSLVAEDIREVLAAEGLQSAIIYGASYGSYIAGAFAAENPDTIAALVLDSPLLSTDDHHAVRAAARGVLWEGEPPNTRRAAALLREAVARDSIHSERAYLTTRLVFEDAGPQALAELLRRVVDGSSSLWFKAVGLTLGTAQNLDPAVGVPYTYEFDLVGTIAYRELNYAPPPDGLPFDPSAEYAAAAESFPHFEAEPYDLREVYANLSCPVVVLSGSRDLRTPRTIAEEIVRLAPRGELVAVEGAGHSILDTRSVAARAVMRVLAAGTTVDIGEHAAELSRLANDHGPSLPLRAVLTLSRLSARSGS